VYLYIQTNKNVFTYYIIVFESSNLQSREYTISNS